MLFDFLTNYVHTSSTGAPAGYTGSPGDGNNCKACHTSSVSVQNTGVITSNIPGTGYTPGNTYTITASVTGNSTKFGFQASPQNASGNLIGTLISTNAQTQLTGGSKYITHSFSGTTGSGSKSWSFDWRAPAAGTGNVTFYAAFNVSNSNNSSTGDTIKLKSVTITEDLTNNKDLTSFKFSALNPVVTGTINQGAQTVVLTVPFGTDVSNLVPTITHTGASVNPPSGTGQDFSSPQSYTITAQNSSTKTYTVTVNVELNDSKDITSFKFSDLNPEVVGVINQNTQIVELTVPDNTNLTNLVPTITHTGTSINPPSGSANDFSSSKDYTVTAENGSTKTYTVIVEEENNTKDITSFKFSDLNPEAIGTIDPNAQTIDITVPSGTNVVSLTPTIMHTGASVNPPSDSANDFSSPQIYTVTAHNGSTKSYTVSVNIQTLVENLSLKNSLEIYPNPASDKVYIKQSDLNKIIRISVINRTGKIVKTFAMPSAMENFSIADFMPGIYYIKADTEKGTIIKKVIKL